MKKHILLPVFVLIFSTGLIAQAGHQVVLNVSVADSLQEKFQSDGRLYIFISENPYGEPRFQLWPVSPMKNYIFARNYGNWKAGGILKIDAGSGLIRTGHFDLGEVPEGEYKIQVLWDQNAEGSRINSAGNLHSKVQSVNINKDQEIGIRLEQEIPPLKLADHKFVKLVDMKSDTLSSWWDKPVKLKASVLLPSGYFDNPELYYPVRYNVAGYGGRYNRVNQLVREQSKFSQWWFSGEAPQVINVFLDGDGPFGDSYQVDSENNGPYGYALIHELIPYIEDTYRGLATAESRFVDGCSTGGWVSLALQIFYPDCFNGAFSYSPDAVEFENYQTINIYRDKNAFYNEWGNPRPVARDITGDPIILMQKFIQLENVQGSSNTYLNSGQQIGAHTALYSPWGENGLPSPLFDPLTGEIDRDVAEYWKKYDLKIYLKENWGDIGPRLQGKIWIWMGDMDHFLLNPATRALDEYLKSTSDPKSDAEIIFEPMQGHCSKFSHREILEMIADKLKNESE
ncbi:MAG: alpha/beta hydrolase-fold protein [Bacteroidales bacterium]